MAISSDNSTTTSSNGTAGITFAHTCGSGANSFLLVTIQRTRVGGNFAVTAVTYNGVSLTQAFSASTGDNDFWYLVNPSSGTHNVVATWVGTSETSINAHSYFGVDQTTPVGTAGEANDSFNSPTVTISSATGELVHDSMLMFNRTMTADSPQAEDWNQQLFSSEVYGGSTKDGAASVTMSWTSSSSGSWEIMAIPIKPAAAAPPTSGRIHRMRLIRALDSIARIN